MKDDKYKRRIANAIIYRYMYQLDPLNIMGILDKKGLLRRKNEPKMHVNIKPTNTDNSNNVSSNSV